MYIYFLIDNDHQVHIPHTFRYLVTAQDFDLIPTPDNDNITILEHNTMCL